MSIRSIVRRIGGSRGSYGLALGILLFFLACVLWGYQSTELLIFGYELSGTWLI